MAEIGLQIKRYFGEAGTRSFAPGSRKCDLVIEASCM
jgi:hypothetical protein